ncbi:MAG TPA: hypothetical protein VGP36_02885 [Mycobacteriales bacterium]|jgi:hypothetical protein|nr:hypothetical protein [Mycobacteriales bacterium]
MTGPRDRWCVLYVDTDDHAAVVEATARLLGPGSSLDVFRAPGFTVQVDRNPDRTRGPHFLDWPTTVGIDASPDADLTAFVATLTSHYRAAGCRVAAESPWSGERPAPDP